MDAFSLLYYNLLQAKLGLFVFGANLLNRMSNLFFITLFVTSVCRLLSVGGKHAGCETPNIEDAGSNSIRSKIVLIRGLLHIFLVSLFKADCLSCIR